VVQSYIRNDNMEELKKPNDILVATLSAPNSSVLDLL